MFALAWIRLGAVLEGPSGSIASAKSELLSEPFVHSSGNHEGTLSVVLLSNDLISFWRRLPQKVQMQMFLGT